MSGGSFSADIAAIRERARQKMEAGEAILAGEEEHADDIVDLLRV
jgi:hypothetical protein